MSLRASLLLAILSSIALTPALSQDGGDLPPSISAWRAWTLLDDDGAANWTAEFVSLGNFGTQVFCHRSNYVTGGMLLSAHDGDPPVPVWSTSTHPGDPEASDSAATTDLHASLVRLPAGTPDAYWFTVRMFDSLGERWSWTYPQITGGRSVLDLSRDGQLLVVAIRNPTTGGNDLLVFTPDGPEPAHVWPLPGGVIWGMDLAEEAPRVVLGLEHVMHIADVLTGETLWQWDWGGAALSNVPLTLSADGTLFAHGFLGPQMRVMRWDGATYATLFGRDMPEGGATRCIRIARDNSALAYGVVFQYPSTVVYTECAAIPSGELLLSDRVESGGSYQNSCMDVAISEDGLLVAVAQAGDQTSEEPEFRIYARAAGDDPIFMINLPGSALNVDISPDGRTFVVGSREVHINQLGAGGRIDLVRLDPRGLFLAGTPSPGHAGTLMLRLPEETGLGATPWLLYAGALATTPIALPGGDTLFLDPLQMRFLAMPPLAWLGPYPTSSIEFTWPNDAGLVGLTIYLQALAVTQGTHAEKLTTNAFPLTVLP
ncbi:MAG: WD40 repeat domain-containing protein [Planctomycetota bacterium]|jgi:hypothetical protein